MTGDKHDGDPRLRTPMQWTRERAAGFTRGQPWEPLPGDSFTANVAAQEPDSASLLHWYRRLIALRAAHPALGAAASFVPLDAASDAALGYLRQGGDETVLVVANLGSAPLAGATFTSAGAVLAPGTWTARPLVGDTAGAVLRVRRDGRVGGWSPAATLQPCEFRVYTLARATR